MSQSLMIIINPSAGKEKAGDYEAAIKETLGAAYSRVSVKYTKGPGDATQFAKSAAENKFDLVVALGGDGTVNETVNGLAPFAHPPKLGIVPMGTVNDLARALNIPINPDKAIELLARGKSMKIDLGRANDRYYSNVLAIGKAAQAIHNVDIKEKSMIGPIAYLKAVVKEIMEDDSFFVKLDMDKESWEGEAAVVMVGLIDSLGGLKSVLPEVEVGDGYLHILVIKRLNVSKLVNMAPSLLFGKAKESKNIEYFKTKTLKIEAMDSDIHESDVDGEKGPDLPLTIEILPQHISVISEVKT